MCRQDKKKDRYLLHIHAFSSCNFFKECIEISFTLMKPIQPHIQRALVFSFGGKTSKFRAIIVFVIKQTRCTNLFCHESFRAGPVVLLESCLQTCMTYTIAECTVNKVLMMDRRTVRNM